VYNSKKQEADAAKLAANADPCKDSDYRDTLGTKVMSGGNNGRVDTYLYTSVTLNNDGEIDTSSSTKMFADRDFYNMSEDKCHAIHDLYAKAKKYEDAIANCEANKNNLSIAAMLAKVSKRSPTYEKLYVEEKNGKKVLMYGEVNCGPLDSSLTATDVELFSSQCLFVPLQLGFVVDNPDMPFCNHNGQCKDVQQIKIELSRLQSLLKEIEPAVARSVIDGAKKGKKLSKGAEIGKGLAIGAGVGAGVGGLATAITAFVERNNITCKVGDGLNSVGLGKSHTIDSLKNFYVKWNLKLPDTVVPTSEVIDRESWDQACTQFNSKLYDCPNVQINFKKNGKYEIIPSACKISGNLCIRNYAVSASHEID